MRADTYFMGEDSGTGISLLQVRGRIQLELGLAHSSPLFTYQLFTFIPLDWAVSYPFLVMTEVMYSRKQPLAALAGSMWWH